MLLSYVKTERKQAEPESPIEIADMPKYLQ